MAGGRRGPRGARFGRKGILLMDRVRSSPAPLFSAATICRCRSGSSQLVVWTSTVSTVAPGATTRAVWRTSSRSRRTAGASDSSRHGERAEDVTGIRRDRGPLVRTREDARDDALVVHHHHVLCLEGVLPAGAASRDGRRLGGASGEAAPVIKWYVTVVPITGPYFDMTPLSDPAAFVTEAPRQSCDVTFAPLHVGHLGLAVSRSDMLMATSNGLLGRLTQKLVARQ